MIIFKLIFFFFLFIFFVLALVVFSFVKQIRVSTNLFRGFQQSKKEKSEGDEVIDNRSRERKQIIPDNEGEYVDFTEVDN